MAAVNQNKNALKYVLKQTIGIYNAATKQEAIQHILFNEIKLEAIEILKKSTFVSHKNYIKKEKKLFQLDDNIMNIIMKDIVVQYGTNMEKSYSEYLQ